ncbi:hypothetical protein [Corynebacterium pseudodiphtheriticum]|uniref:DUF2442 domain-containing protein n=1 Tax=Corynebacterium pseudodiphtheriticum TaxID=37637 RepID=A0ABT7FZ78_9CORY|nr:hypothetical protein [Corynebacterium pseudodiphtheriticum]MDK4291048.1 hypothetical protein [Corynebacterium pseudodiphtheriticum]MDK4322641.1 hypothetical protein [Corynebacterium pseudodiphtheriticum]
MELLKGPLWEMGDCGDTHPNEHFVRIRLHDDSAIAEFTLNELCSFFGINGPDCLRMQFKVWHDLGAFAWEPVDELHLEARPFAEYFSSSKVPGCYSPQPLPEPTNGRVEWGMKKEL